MARRVKTGLNYFPKDVDYYDDFKIMDLLNDYGPLGQTIYDVVLAQIYREGYYLEAPLDKLAAKVVRVIGNRWVKDKSLVLQVIQYCADIGLFDKDLLMQSVITSVGIQRRYSEVTVRNKVNKDRYWLIDEKGQPLLNAPINPISVTETIISVAETPVNASDIQQKESKGNKTKQNKTICPELQGEAAGPVIFELILNDKTFYPVYQTEIEKYKILYPAVNVEQEYKKMIGWLDTHPDNRKTSRGITKFINGWLSRTQDSARPKQAEAPVKHKNAFHNFDQRATNYDALVAEQVKTWLGAEMEGGETAVGE